MAIYQVMMHYDASAAVWWAESEDVVGLVSQGDTYDELRDNVRHIVPDLLELNMPHVSPADVTLRFVADPVEEPCLV